MPASRQRSICGGDHWQILEAPPHGAQGACRLYAVHDRHLHVHQDDVIVDGLDRV
jgi:hypothetical protein